jgi:hypothetical protein
MHEAELKQMRKLIRIRLYVMTLHAEDEMDADGFTIFDVEHVILTGTIIERQKDYSSQEWKYLVSGESIAGDKATVVAKFGPTGKLVMITVYRD